MTAKDTRPDWDSYFLRMASSVAARADCTRRKVGAVVVMDRRVVSTGYNGTPSRGQAGCLDGRCPRGRLTHDELPGYSAYDGPGACIAIHAEDNALRDAQLRVPSFVMDRGAVLYVTDEPCSQCWALLRGTPTIGAVVWPEGRWDRG